MKKMIAAFVACVVVFGAVTACAKKEDPAVAARAQFVKDSLTADSIAKATPAVVDSAVTVDSAATAAAPEAAPATK